MGEGGREGEEGGGETERGKGEGCKGTVGEKGGRERRKGKREKEVDEERGGCDYNHADSTRLMGQKNRLLCPKDSQSSHGFTGAKLVFQNQ